MSDASDFSFFWHDYERPSAACREKRPVGAVRRRGTDADLNEIDAPLELTASQFWMRCQSPRSAC